MTQKQCISAFVQFGQFLKDFLESESIFYPTKKEFKTFGEKCLLANQKNGWFTEDEIKRALFGIAFMLDEKKLVTWLHNYSFDYIKPKNIGVVMAGNIPAVGFHDLLCVLISGNRIEAKLSSQDEELIKAITQQLINIEPALAQNIVFTKRPLKNIDAFIGTGSNNSARYFDYYFAKYPNIIRNNRTSVAIVTNDISDAELKALGNDIFFFYGLGCRNVTKVYFEEGLNLDRFFNAIVDFGYVMDNKKYANNYHYYQTLFLMNHEKFLDNNFLILKEAEPLNAQVSVLHYQFFSSLEQLKLQLQLKEKEIQVIVSNQNLSFGQAQSPELWDYADGINTLEFLANLAHQKN